MTAPASDASSNSLPRQQRAWIALYSLVDDPPNRLEILRLNDVTEEDLREFEKSWQLLRAHQPFPHYLVTRLQLPKPE